MTESAARHGNPGHVLLFVFPDYGHVRPMLGVSRGLVARGHRVSWITDHRYAAAVKEVGAELVGYDSTRPAFGSGPVVSAAEMGELGVAFMTESIEVILPLARERFAGDVPDLVLYDFESATAARTVAERWRRPTVQVFPNLASNESWSLHAQVFDSSDDSVHRVVALVQKFLTDTGQDPGRIWSFLTPFDQRNLVMLPRAFQPHGDTFDERFTFVGHAVEDAAGDVPAWSPPAGAGPVVLMSLGTEAADPAFFATCREAFAGGPEHLVMTLGRRHAPVGEPTPSNMETHEWLPHPAVLPHADVFVTHGGMGSIVEALYFGAPMVVVPHMPEPELNGRRIVELGLGRLLPVGELTADTLRAAVREVAADDALRARVARMRDSLLADGGIPRAVEALEGYLPRP
ncbi:MAG: macrolide family glycosyltransferase [Actinocatenispora sp.]